jgi:hypothetical protein
MIPGNVLWVVTGAAHSERRKFPAQVRWASLDAAWRRMDHLRPANRPLKLTIGAPQELEWSAVHRKVRHSNTSPVRAARSLAA